MEKGIRIFSIIHQAWDLKTNRKLQMTNKSQMPIVKRGGFDIVNLDLFAIWCLCFVISLLRRNFASLVDGLRALYQVATDALDESAHLEDADRGEYLRDLEPATDDDLIDAGRVFFDGCENFAFLVVEL